MSRTRRKFDEANFFCERMEEQRFSHPQFDYYLSAFISAARSALWVMRSEYHLVPGWEGWYQTKQASPVEEAFLRKVNHVRVRSEKTHPIEAHIAVVISIPLERVTPELKERLESATGERVWLTVLPITEGGEITLPDDFIINAFVGTLDSVERHIDEFPGEDFVEVCRRYLRFPEEVITECETNYAL